MITEDPKYNTFQIQYKGVNNKLTNSAKAKIKTKKIPKNFPTKKSLDQMASLVNFMKYLMKTNANLLKLFQKIEEEGTLPTLLCKVRVTLISF
jgi:hypothetical protein